MIEYSNVRYLLAKRSLDDRSINQHVVAQLRRELREASQARPIRVLELGAGVGTMVSRLVEWDVIGKAAYTLVDRDVESLNAARAELVRWGGTPPGEPLRIEARGASLDVKLVASDLIDFVTSPEAQGQYDLVVANAVLDLFDLGPTLPAIWRALAPGGLFWFTITFDGETILLPASPLDAAVMRLYHASMGADAAGTRAGHSQTGRRLLEAVPATGARLLAAGSSDWVVFPQAGSYASDEAYFLHHIVQTIFTALDGHPELPRAQLEEWARARHAQIEHAQLCYVAHQLDVLGRAPR